MSNADQDRSEDELYNKLRREDWLIVLKSLSNRPTSVEQVLRILARQGKIIEFIWQMDNLEEVRQYGWTPASFVEYAKEKYGKQ